MEDTSLKKIFFTECNCDPDDILTIEDDVVENTVWVNVGGRYDYDREAICLTQDKAITMAHKILDYYGSRVSE